MRVDQAPETGKFRATASASIDATAGAWGDGDMLCVTIDASGEIALATATDCMGVIYTAEGRQPVDDDSHKNVIGGKKYTVLTICELVEAEVGTSPALSAGDTIWAAAAGDVDVTATPGVGAIFVGKVLNGGSRVRIHVGLAEPSTA